MRRLFFRLGGIFLGMLVTLVLLECLLRFLPVSMGLYRTERFDKWPLQNSEPKLPYAYSISWAMLNPHRGTTNNYGHIAPFDFMKGSQPVLVIGDSFIESLMNEYDDTLQGQLGRKINSQHSVYGLGASGLSASDYLALSRLAKDEFNPVAAVFLIVDGDFSESLGPRIGHHSLVPDGDTLKATYAPLTGESTAKKIRKRVGDISIYRYFQVNLQFTPEQIWKTSPRDADTKVNSENAVTRRANQKRVADWLMAELPAALGLQPECIVFLMDSDRYAIYKPDQASSPKDSPEVRRYFVERGEKLGFKVSDLDPVFRKRFREDRTKFDYWPIDRHWNRVGHGVGAEEAYRLLYGQGQQKACMTDKQLGRGS